MSIEECLLLRYILAVPPCHQFQLQPDIYWDATSNTLTPLPLQWSISFSTALFMISLTENQRSEPITQICQDNIQDGILFTICGRCVYLTVFCKGKVRCLTLVSHTHTRREKKTGMALWSSKLSVKRLSISNQFLTQTNGLLCACVYVWLSNGNVS